MHIIVCLRERKKESHYAKQHAVSLLLHYRSNFFLAVIEKTQSRIYLWKFLRALSVTSRGDAISRGNSSIAFGEQVPRVTSRRVPAGSELIRHFWRTSEREGYPRRDEGEICSRREKTKRSLFEDHRGIECYSRLGPRIEHPRGRTYSLPAEGVGETVKSI